MNVQEHWPMTVTVPVEEDGTVVMTTVDNIDADGCFLLPQVYAFPMNREKDGGSVTMHRCCIPVGEEVERGYEGVRLFLLFIGVTEDEMTAVCIKLGFPEIVGL